jgi:formylglycine-generating enzyme required for sulfatase activity
MISRIWTLLLTAGGFALAASVSLVADSTPAAPPKGDHKSYSEKIPGTEVSFDMVAIPGGSFTMGSPETEKGRNADEGPQHEVQVRPFWMAKLELSWEEFEQFWNSNPEMDPKPKVANEPVLTRPTPTYVDADYGHEHEGHPVMCMSHHCAMEYCRWLTRVTGKTYRLPTEAEWEYAARAGTKTAYYFGDDAKELEEHAWFKKNSPTEEKEKGTTHKLGTKKANAFGLHDMYGNVAEWTLDHYQPDFYKQFAGKVAQWPVILPTDKRWSHVVRGGSWADDAVACRSAARRGSDKSWIKHDPQIPQSIWWLTKMDVIGFRVVRAVEEQDNLKDLRSKITKQSD